ncbi:MAG: ExeA family protein [Candidatus Zhuqueibacterota bacterium]
MYLNYWGLTKHAFNNVPDPTMYFDMHATVENAVAELLFAIEEADECLAVVVGDVGLGKTMSLRVTLDSLDQSKYRIAFVTNPDLTFPQLLREIIGQLKNQPCMIKNKDELLEEFNKILFTTADEGKRVLIFIDEGNVIRRMNLQSLRLLTNMQEDDRNLFTMVLAGQPELGKNLEHPSNANLYQRIGVYCRLNKMESRDVVKSYVEHRMECAGVKRQIFTEDAYTRIYEYSEKGIPRLVNRICKLALKAGETNKMQEISGEVIVQIGERFARTEPLKHKDDSEPKEGEPAMEVKHPRPKKKSAPAADAEENITVVEDVKPEAVLPEADAEPEGMKPKNILSQVKSDLGREATPMKELLDRLKDRNRHIGRSNPFFK